MKINNKMTIPEVKSILETCIKDMQLGKQSHYENLEDVIIINAFIQFVIFLIVLRNILIALIIAISEIFLFCICDSYIKSLKDKKMKPYFMDKLQEINTWEEIYDFLSEFNKSITNSSYCYYSDWDLDKLKDNICNYLTLQEIVNDNPHIKLEEDKTFVNVLIEKVEENGDIYCIVKTFSNASLIKNKKISEIECEISLFDPICFREPFSDL